MDQVNDLVNDILQDNKSGSVALTKKILDFYRNSCQIDPIELYEINTKINDAHVGMGLVRNVNSIVLKKLDSDGCSISGFIDDIDSRIETCASEAVKKADDLFFDSCKIATLSDSSMVRESILRNRNKIEKVYILESRPNLEGQRLAEELKMKGIDAAIAVDAAVYGVAERSDFALVGSDSVLNDWSLIHKIGTYPMSLAFRDKKKEFVSLTMNLKREKLYDRTNYPKFCSHDPSEVTKREVCVINEYYDITPAEYVSSYITEDGIKEM